MNITIPVLGLFCVLCLAQASLAANATTPSTKHQTFDSSGKSTQHIEIDASTGEPILKASTEKDPLATYRAQFLEATTAKQMADFITRYEAADPEKLVPRARIRMRTFEAFETALHAGKCTEAKAQHQRITSYKVTIPFSYEDCTAKPTNADAQSLYLAGVRFEDGGDLRRARTQFRKLIERFPNDALALKAADRLARLVEIAILEAGRSGTAATTAGTTDSLTPSTPPKASAIAACPKNLGYLRPRLVFPELRENPNLAEPIEDILRKAGSLDAAITEVERLTRENQGSINQAAVTLQQYQTVDQVDARKFRCAKAESNLCAASYYYHLLHEGEYFYAELLNSLRCRKTGKMQHAQYAPAPLK